MHKYYVGYMHARGPESAYGNITVTRPVPIRTEADIDQLTADLRSHLRLSNLVIMGLFKLER